MTFPPCCDGCITLVRDTLSIIAVICRLRFDLLCGLNALTNRPRDSALPQTKKIDIDIEVNRVIEARRQSFDQSHNEILREIIAAGFGSDPVLEFPG